VFFNTKMERGCGASKQGSFCIAFQSVLLRGKMLILFCALASTWDFIMVLILECL
jgi:hypothetical protein